MNEETRNFLINNANGFQEGGVGWLSKAKNSTTYQKRYFVIQGSVLLYFETAESDFGHPNGVISLLGAKIQPVAQSKISIGCSSRTFVLKAQNDDERDKWINLLKLGSCLTPQHLSFMSGSLRTVEVVEPPKSMKDQLNFPNFISPEPKRDEHGEEKKGQEVSEKEEVEIDERKLLSRESVASFRRTSFSDDDDNAENKNDTDLQAQNEALVNTIQQLRQELDELNATIDEEKEFSDVLQKQLEKTVGALTEVTTEANLVYSVAKQVQSSHRGSTDDSIASHAIFNPVRNLVRQKKRSWREGGFDLDLVQVTPEIFAMGLPSTGIEALYRNPYSQVVKFFDTHHPNNYLIYNLCIEREFEKRKFHGRWRHYGFEDHTPPTLRIAKMICEDAEKWLNSNPGGVIGVHCKAGKGRTGTVVTMLMMHRKKCSSAKEALELFEKSRMVSGHAMRNPGQFRYVYYYERVLKEGFPVRQPTVIKKVTFQTVPNVTRGACTPYIIIVTDQYDPEKERRYDSRDHHQLRVYSNEESIEFDVNFEFEGSDIRVELHSADSSLLSSSRSRLCLFFFHPAFETSPFRLEKDQIDEAYQDEKHSTFNEKFSATVEFAAC